MVDDIIRLMNTLIVPETKDSNTRLVDRNRRVGIIVKKLKKLQDAEPDQKHNHGKD